MKALPRERWGGVGVVAPPFRNPGNRLFWLFSTFLFIEFDYIVRAVHLLSCAYIAFAVLLALDVFVLINGFA